MGFLIQLRPHGLIGIEVHDFGIGLQLAVSGLQIDIGVITPYPLGVTGIGTAHRHVQALVLGQCSDQVHGQRGSEFLF